MVHVNIGLVVVSFGSVLVRTLGAFFIILELLKIIELNKQFDIGNRHGRMKKSVGLVSKETSASIISWTRPLLGNGAIVMIMFVVNYRV